MAEIGTMSGTTAMAKAAKRAKKAATRKRRADAPPHSPTAAPAGCGAAAGPLTLNALESHLWEAANILRGSPLGRTDWMSYILPLLFFKRICDVWDEEAAAARELYGDSEFEDFPEAHRFQVPTGCHWQDVRTKATNVGTALQNALRGIEKANDKHLYGVFGDATWTNKEQLPDALLKDLVEHFSSITLTNAAVTSDILGDAYEVLIKRFAEITNKKAGEFYTPRAVVRLMAAILDPKPGETVYDPMDSPANGTSATMSIGI
jgi:type I restriction enzyme M protein